jgi:site-specific DNA-methyltransferase (adenine-specific)
VKPYYSHAGITIYHGDCREGLRRVCGGAIFADPPYGVGKAEWDAEFQHEWINEASNSSSFMAITPGISNLLKMPLTTVGQEYRWTLSLRITNGMTRGAVGFGNWIACLLYATPGMSINKELQDAGEITIRGDMPDHPSPKPLDALLWILKRLPGTNIIDPFCGSGTALLAAKKLGKTAIGIEIEEKYCEIAAKRLSQEVFDFSGAIPIRGEIGKGES